MNISPEKLKSLNRLNQWAVLIATVNPENNIFPYLNADGSRELNIPRAQGYPGSLFVKGQKKSRQSLGYLPGAIKMGGVPERIANLARGLIGVAKGPDKVLVKIGDKLGVVLSPRELTKKDGYVHKEPQKSDEDEPENTMQGTGATDTNESRPHIFNDLLNENESNLLDPFLDSSDLKPKAAQIISMLAAMYASEGKNISIGNPEQIKPKTKNELEKFGFVFNQTNNIYIYGSDGKGDGSDKDTKGDDGDKKVGKDKKSDVEDKDKDKEEPKKLKKASGLKLNYGTPGSTLSERIILRSLIKTHIR